MSQAVKTVFMHLPAAFVDIRWKAGMLGRRVPIAGDLSRNRTVGLRIGRGETLEEITKDMTAIAEGVLTARSAHMLAKKLNVQAS